MKKIFLLLVCLCFSAFVFAQDSNFSIQRINVPEGFSGLANKMYMSEEISMSDGNILVEFTPETDEVRIIFTCFMTQYQRLAARNTCLEVLQDFLTLNKYSNEDKKILYKKRYKSFDYLKPDSEIFIRDGGLRKAQYIVTAKLF